VPKDPTPQEWQLLAELKVTPARIQACLQLGSYAEAQAALTALKVEAKQRFKDLALDLHPDRTGDDPVKTQKFKLLSAVVDKMERELHVVPSQPVYYAPMRHTVVVIIRSGETYTTSHTSNTTYPW